MLSFSRLHEHHEEISGLVRIRLAGFPGRADGDLLDGKIILTGPRSMQDAARACAKRVGEFEDWDGLILKSCIAVRRALEEGTPVLDLGDGLVEPDAPFAVEPLIRVGEPTLAFGPGGTGKSTLALMVAMVATTGLEFWQLRSGVEQARILYLDYEDEEASQRRRLAKLAAGLGRERPHIHWKRAESSLTQIAESLSRQIAREKITALIVDSAGLACGVEPESADSANAYFRALRSLKIDWSLTIAHQPKGKERDPYPFGSVFWWNNPRMIWRTGLSRNDDNHDGIHLGLWHRKANNGMLGKPLAFHIRFVGDEIRVTREEPRSVAEFRGDLSEKERVLAALEDAAGPLTYAELESITHIELGSLYVVVGRLSKDDQVQKLGNGFTLLHPPSSPFLPEDIDAIPFT